jgi:hypothetical protein
MTRRDDRMLRVLCRMTRRMGRWCDCMLRTLRCVRRPGFLLWRWLVFFRPRSDGREYKTASQNKKHFHNHIHNRVPSKFFDFARLVFIQRPRNAFWMPKKIQKLESEKAKSRMVKPCGSRILL